MSWTAAEFLDLLEHRGIMAADHVDDLREQLAAVEGGVHAVHVARKLVDAGYLNPYFAKTLLEEGYRSRRAAKDSSEGVMPGGPKANAPSGGSRRVEELDLAPLEEDELEERAALAKGPPIDLRIELPPMHDPDAWPTASDSTQVLRSQPRSSLGSLKRIGDDIHTKRLPSSDTTWLLWALGGAVAVLVMIVAMLLVWR